MEDIENALETDVALDDGVEAAWGGWVWLPSWLVADGWNSSHIHQTVT